MCRDYRSSTTATYSQPSAVQMNRGVRPVKHLADLMQGIASFQIRGLCIMQTLLQPEAVIVLH